MFGSAEREAQNWASSEAVEGWKECAPVEPETH
jgi:hypothetical protein